MKTIVMTANLTSFSSRADGGVAFRGVTPELTTVEKVALFELQSVNVRAVFEPIDYAVEDKLTVHKEIGSKTPSERLRGVLFVAFRHSKEAIEFDEFYKREMERIIQNEKDKLPQQPF